MNVLITGGAGFIGSNLALDLLKHGHEVTVLDNLSPQIHGADKYNSTLFQSIDGKVKFIEGSVTDIGRLAEAIVGQDAIVHLAAETGTGQSMYEINRYVDVNIGGTAKLLDLLANSDHSVKKVVVASSRSIYGEGKFRDRVTQEVVYPEARKESDMATGKFDHLSKNGVPLEVLPTDEDSKLHPSSVYGITKLNQEQMVMTVCASLGIGGCALRFQNVYGPGQSLSNPYTGILSIFSTRIRNGKSISIFEDGLESRDFVYIDDVVLATRLALFSENSKGEVFGIGSGVPTTVLEVAQLLVQQYGIDVPIAVTGSFRLGDIRHNYADLAKASRLLGFKPTVDFAKGLKLFAQWVTSQAVQADGYDASIAEMKAKGLFKG